MFYMGGMTLGYFSPHAKDRDAETAEQPSLPTIEPVATLRNRLSAVAKAMFAREIARRQPHIRPIHVFY